MDLSQEVFVKVLRNWESVDLERNLKPWIRRIALNTCMNFQRDKKKTLSLSAKDEEYGLMDQIASPENTEEEVLARLRSENMSYHIDKLKPEQRVAILLRHFEGLSYKEIARAMDKPEGTIKTYLYQGRKALARRIGEEKGGGNE